MDKVFVISVFSIKLVETCLKPSDDDGFASKVVADVRSKMSGNAALR